MTIYQRCAKPFSPQYPDMPELCEKCVDELIDTRRKACPIDDSECEKILRDMQSCINDTSNVQALLESPGVTLAISRMAHIAKLYGDVTMLALNSFRLGAFLAFKQADLNKILEK